MAGVGRVPVAAVANQRAEGSGGVESGDAMAFVGFVVEVAQHRGRPVESAVVAEEGEGGVGEQERGRAGSRRRR